MAKLRMKCRNLSGHLYSVKIIDLLLARVDL